jgi:hypothetical protein
MHGATTPEEPSRALLGHGLMALARALYWAAAAAALLFFVLPLAPAISLHATASGARGLRDQVPPATRRGGEGSDVP